MAKTKTKFQYKLGCLPPRPDRVKAVPRLRDYLEAEVKLPSRVDYASAAAESIRRMYLNDRYGCCVISGKAHQLGVYSVADKEVPVVLCSDQEILDQYNRLKAGPGDSGCIITDVLDHMIRNGLVAGGKAYKLDGYVAVDNTDADMVKAAILLFGSLTLGIQLPKAWAESPEGGTWDVTTSRNVGGHDVAAVGYDEKGVVVSTWGGLRTITWKAFTSRKWVVECYAQLAPLWYGDDNVARAVGSNADKLKADLKKLREGVLPDPEPTDPVDPTPDPVDPPTPSVFQFERDVVAVLEKHGYKVTKSGK